MAPQIKIQQSATPWRPTDDSDVVETFLHYDFPRVGIVEQGGQKYLFGCVDEYDSLTLWAYVAVGDEDVERARQSPDHAVEHFETSASPISIAIAKEEHGIVLSTLFASKEGATFLEAVVASMTAAVEDFRRHARLNAPG